MRKEEKILHISKNKKIRQITNIQLSITRMHQISIRKEKIMEIKLALKQHR
jgi:hypothetical protein